MKRPLLLVVAILLVAVVTGAVLARGEAEAAGSSLSRGAAGWLAARVYLERSGVATRLLDGPLAEAPAGSVLALVFPWQNRRNDLDPIAVDAHLARGGSLLVAYGSELAPAASEVTLLGDLGVGFELVSPKPVAPWRWRESGGASWRLRPAKPWPGGGQLHLRRPRWVPAIPRSNAWLVGPDGHTVAGAWRRGRGVVVVLPAELLCNARLREPAHAGLLESLRRTLPGAWTFDELHHGLARPGAVPAEGSRRGLDMLLLQLLLLYGVAALALSRRLGPAWRETPPLAGNAAAFLLRLGRLHHRLGHHREGARLLLDRAAELDRRFVAPASLRDAAEHADAAGLVAVGRQVAAAQGAARR